MKKRSRPSENIQVDLIYLSLEVFQLENFTFREVS